MIKRRELHECNDLYELLKHPSVFPFVRQKANSADEYWFLTNQLMEDEENGKAVSRTITDDWGQPIGTITVYDVQDGAGFLGTWIGTPHQGKGYNQKSKELFLNELFFELDFHTVFLRIRTENTKSLRAAEKIGYIMDAKESHPSLYEQINQGDKHFELMKIQKDFFYLYTASQNKEEEEQAM
ncbi:GNAT family N-acetyltransferase [Viridibacillus sp. FSL E2-0187]|uniref:Alanine acetyltransferase n=1 Tax=Viridibacillus arvi TaxID=263475 RepID=A0A0M0LDL4_9BACL|nr:GNAT family N-acetyltransferase [Viridibacillus arvi]KOO48813.1 alanine acetyltransferase [Viridibacillus arvi]